MINGQADQIWVWKSADANWEKYFYRKQGSNPATGWCKQKTTTVTTDTIKNGETFFFQRAKGGSVCDITLSGGVTKFTATPKYANLVAEQYCFLAYPWPVSLPIAGFEKYQGNPKGYAVINGQAEQIWLWRNGDWVKYFYRKQGSNPATGWCKAKETSVTTDTIGAGEGFFFYRGKGGVTDEINFTYESK